MTMHYNLGVWCSQRGSNSVSIVYQLMLKKKLGYASLQPKDDTSNKVSKDYTINGFDSSG